MKSILIAATAALFLCVGCSSKPADTDVAGVLTENVPKALKAVATVEQTKADITVSGDDAVVKFKSVLKLSQPLFEAVDLDTVAKSTESDVALFRQIEEAAQGLSSAAKDELAGAIKAATTKPVFIAQTAAAGATAEWYGSFKDKKVVDKWVASDFKTEAEPVLKGQPRAAFEATAVETSQAKAWFAALKTQQADVLQKIETAKKLAQKDVQIAQKDAQIESATASAQRERDAKEQLLAAREKQLRQLPVTLSLRNAAIGNTKTVVMQSARAMTIRIEVSRALQRFEHDYQLEAGKPLAIGHLEGWGFLRGDVVRFSNPSFDPRVLTVP